MRTSLAAALAAGLLAAAPGVAAAQANGPGDPAAPPDHGAPGAPLPPHGRVPAVGHLRDSWYIGFGLGSGVANVTVNGETRSFGQVLRDNGAGSGVNFALQFEVGATLRPDLLLGLDVRMLRAQAKRSADDALLGVMSSDILAMLTWFPAREGFFLRGGFGVAGLSLDARVGNVTASDDHVGFGVLGGVGYAFWLAERFNLTLNLDVSAQKFGGGADVPSSARFADLYLGFVWY